MTDLSNEPASPATPIEGDGILRVLVSIANANPDPSTWITLFVNGMMLNGQMINNYEYLTRMWDGYTSGFNDETAATIRASAMQGVQPPDPAAEEQQPAPNFIHLQECRVFSPNAEATPQNGLLWRGRIAEVTGFALGRLSNEPRAVK